MCGIIGYVGKKNAIDVVIGSLEHLEYRGYDSAGIAIHTPAELVIEKSVGKLSTLKEKIKNRNIFGGIGMGHTRWATHGAPSFNNAHPHFYGRVAIVHNGILENHKTIREKFINKGHTFYSDTDTEVAAHLLDSFLQEGQDPLLALSTLCDTLHGAFALGIMLKDEPNKIYFVKNGSPLLVAKGKTESFFASDQAALVDHQPVYYSLQDHEMGFISEEEVAVFDLKGNPVKIHWSLLVAQKEEVKKLTHKHFMHKEIFEQKETIDRVVKGRLDHDGINFAGFNLDFLKIIKANKIHIVACGSSFYAGMIAKSLLETMVQLPVSVEIASEYRYRDALIDDKTLVIAISQSGETIDTLAALKKAHSLGAICISFCNVLGSAIASLCEMSAGNFFLDAGLEISVACTKAFMAQLIALRLFTFALAKKCQRFHQPEELLLLSQLASLKEAVSKMLAQEEEIKTIAKSLMNEQRILYLGRGEFYPVALEGALKMKEISYIFAEGYPAGELKHGPIATIDHGMYAVVIFGNDGLHNKTASNVQELKARGAKIISIAPNNLIHIKEESDFFIGFDNCAPMFEPILATIPLQLLAYHLSDLKGIDVDKPRNLAKSVTVE